MGEKGEKTGKTLSFVERPTCRKDRLNVSESFHGFLHLCRIGN